MNQNRLTDHLPAFVRRALNLAVKNDSPQKLAKREGYIPKIIPKTVQRTRVDVGDWNTALRLAGNVDRPRRAKISHLRDNALLDGHLTSQVELRMQHVLSTPFTLKDATGEENEEYTKLVSEANWTTDINRRILETVPHGHSLVELSFVDDKLKVTLFPRPNVIPEKGVLLFDESDDKGINYREVREFGTWLLEFGSEHDLGLINKAIPHVLFKRFAQSCWSELCEIYGIPPRFIKTDTTDPEMLDRAEQMLRDMGAAAYFIIDTTEEFQFAKGADTNGDVYNNLIRLCKDEISLIFVGAIIGQDTKHGNESKEKSSMELFDKLIQADRKMVAGYWNTTVIPALVHIGILPAGLTFEFQQEEDLEKLWGMVRDLLPHKNIPNWWLKEKFGIEAEDKETGFDMYQMMADPKKLAAFAKQYKKVQAKLSPEKRVELQAGLAKVFALDQEEKVDFFA